MPAHVGPSMASVVRSAAMDGTDISQRLFTACSSTHTGAPLTHIGTNRDDTMYAVSTCGNEVILIDSVSFKHIQVFRGLAAITAIDTQGSFTPTVSPRGDNLIISGGIGTMQVYNPARDRVEYEMEVFHRNYISRTQGKAVIPVLIQHVAFCKVSPQSGVLYSRGNGCATVSCGFPPPCTCATIIDPAAACSGT